MLVLRLIGLTFDVCDTHDFKSGVAKKEMDYYGIEKTPNLLEIASYVYFPASFLAGPQFPYRLYERFMNKEFGKYVSLSERQRGQEEDDWANRQKSLLLSLQSVERRIRVLFRLLLLLVALCGV